MFVYACVCMMYACVIQLQCIYISSPTCMQGGTIAALTVIMRADLFKGVVLSAPSLVADPESAGFFLVCLFSCSLQ